MGTVYSHTTAILVSAAIGTHLLIGKEHATACSIKFRTQKHKSHVVLLDHEHQKWIMTSPTNQNEPEHSKQTWWNMYDAPNKSSVNISLFWQQNAKNPESSRPEEQRASTQRRNHPRHSPMHFLIHHCLRGVWMNFFHTQKIHWIQFTSNTNTFKVTNGIAMCKCLKTSDHQVSGSHYILTPTRIIIV